LATGSAFVFDGTNVGIGTSSPSTKLQITVAPTSSADNGMRVTDGTRIIQTNITGSAYSYIGIGANETMLYSTGNPLNIVSDGQPIKFIAGTAERMRIDSSGNVGIGTNSPVGRLDVVSAAQDQLSVRSNSTTVGASILVSSGNGTTSNNYSYVQYQNSQTSAYNWKVGTFGSNSFSFYDATVGTERARIDSSGNLLVGTTSGSDRLIVKSAGTSSAAAAITVQNSAGTELLRIRNDGVFYTGGATFSPYNNTTGSAANMVVGASGDLFRSTSSIKYKKNIVNATHGLAELLALRAVTYEGKSEADDGKTFGGLIAEEVHEAGLTEFVQYAKDGSPDALAYGNMVSLCIKAIQEQQALIESLTTRLTALEQK
jgi:hypothetical protein